jgi:hypothetical protein
MELLPSLLSGLRAVCAGFPDARNPPTMFELENAEASNAKFVERQVQTA